MQERRGVLSFIDVVWVVEAVIAVLHQTFQRRCGSVFTHRMKGRADGRGVEGANASPVHGHKPD
jgi:hypothetical protein